MVLGIKGNVVEWYKHAAVNEEQSEAEEEEAPV